MSTDLTITGTRAADSNAIEPVSKKNQLREYHVWLLLCSVAVAAAAFVLRVRTDQRVELAVLPGLPLPELCQFRALLGWDCPGCGLTRSFVYLAAGDVEASLAVNRVGWLFAAVVVLQVPYRLWAICSADGRPLGQRIPWAFLWVPLALLVANWLVKVAALLI
jgi:Protein of unknown function (DUF2752)